MENTKNFWLKIKDKSFSFSRTFKTQLIVFSIILIKIHVAKIVEKNILPNLNYSINQEWPCFSQFSTNKIAELELRKKNFFVKKKLIIFYFNVLWHGFAEFCSFIVQPHSFNSRHTDRYRVRLIFLKCCHGKLSFCNLILDEKEKTSSPINCPNQLENIFLTVTERKFIVWNYMFS